MKRMLQVTALSSLAAFAAAQQQDPAADTFIRVAHVAPNASEVSVDLGADGGLFGGDGAAVDAEALSNLSYRDVTDYVAVAAGNYNVTVNTADGAYQEELDFAAGNYYTIAALGLVAPGGLEQTQAPDDGGFFGFGGGGDTLGFRLEVLEEDVTPLLAAQQPTAPPATGTPAAPGTAADPAAQPADPAAQPTDPATGQAVDPATGQAVDPATGQAVDPAAQPVDPAAGPTVADPSLTQLVTTRLVHAAPGIAPVSLVSLAAGGAAQDTTAQDTAAQNTAQDVDVLINDVPFGDVSNYSDLDPAQLTNVELRIEESPAAALSLSDTTLEPNTVYTLFVIGTPVNDEPLEVLVVGTTLQNQGAQQDNQNN
jgi:hypothetical protein